MKIVLFILVLSVLSVATGCGGGGSDGGGDGSGGYVGTYAVEVLSIKFNHSGAPCSDAGGVITVNKSGVISGTMVDRFNPSWELAGVVLSNGEIIDGHANLYGHPAADFFGDIINGGTYEDRTGCTGIWSVTKGDFLPLTTESPYKSQYEATLTIINKDDIVVPFPACRDTSGLLLVSNQGKVSANLFAPDSTDFNVRLSGVVLSTGDIIAGDIWVPAESEYSQGNYFGNINDVLIVETKHGCIGELMLTPRS